MKLLYLSNLRLPTEKAYGIQIVKMCEAFAGLGLDVRLVFPYRKNTEIKKDIFDYYSVKNNFIAKRLITPDFYIFGKNDPIIVGIKNFISAAILVLYAILHKADIIYSRDEMPLYFLSFFKNNLVFEAHRFSLKRKFFYKRFNKKGVKVVAISKAIKTDLVSSGYNSDKILVAHDGVDLEEFDIDISKEEARKKVGLPLNKRIVMYTGHLFEWKGADVLLEVARLIRNVRNDGSVGNEQFEHGEAVQQFEQCLFVFIGGMKYDIKKFREKSKGAENVLILGYKPHKEIPIFLKAADILVLPNSSKEEISNKYTSPLKLFEYMASGRPIIASDLLSIREVLDDNNSYLFKTDDPESMAKVLDLAIKYEEDAKIKADMALDKVKSFTWQKRADKINLFFLETH